MQLLFKPGSLAAESMLLITTLNIPGICQILSILQLRNLRLRAVEQQLKVTQLGSRRDEIQSWLGSRACASPSRLPQSCQILRSPKQIDPISLHCNVC